MLILNLLTADKRNTPHKTQKGTYGYAGHLKRQEGKECRIYPAGRGDKQPPRASFRPTKTVFLVRGSGVYIISALRGLFGGARGLIMLNLGGARMGAIAVQF